MSKNDRLLADIVAAMFQPGQHGLIIATHKQATVDRVEALLRLIKGIGVTWSTELRAMATAPGDDCVIVFSNGSTLTVREPKPDAPSEHLDFVLTVDELSFKELPPSYFVPALNALGGGE